MSELKIITILAALIIAMVAILSMYCDACIVDPRRNNRCILVSLLSLCLLAGLAVRF